MEKTKQYMPMVERDEWLHPVADAIAERHNRYLARKEAIEKQAGSIVDYANWEEKVDNFPMFTIDSIEEIKNCNARAKFLKLSYPDLSEKMISFLKESNDVVVILTTNHINRVGEQRAFFHTLLNF